MQHGNVHRRIVLHLHTRSGHRCEISYLHLWGKQFKLIIQDPLQSSVRMHYQGIRDILIGTGSPVPEHAVNLDDFDSDPSVTLPPPPDAKKS